MTDDFAVNGLIQRLKHREIHLVWCHRLPERSLCIKGTPILCWRCLGIYIAVLGGALIPFGILIGMPISSPEPIWFLISFAFMIPLVADGVGQALDYWISTNLRRFWTGVLYGFGFSLMLWTITWYFWQMLETLN